MYIALAKPGIFTTLQGGEQTGNRAWGMGPGGVMDEFAARCANHLVHNPVSEAVLEMHFPAPELYFSATTCIALCGAHFGAENNDRPLANWQTHTIEGGTLIRFTRLHSGYRAYLSVYGGFQQGEILTGSATPLPKNTQLLLNKPGEALAGNYEMAILPNAVQKVYGQPGSIYCIPGPEWSLLSPGAQQQIARQNFTLSPQSNRMGFRLEGEGIEHEAVNMLSSAADRGTVQLLPDGRLLVLMAAHQTTGGYPRILSVLSPSLPVLAQTQPGDTFRFHVISLKEAEEQLISWQKMNRELGIA